MTGRWALVRLAVRGLRRHLRASWLVVLLIALPVAAGSYLAIATRTVSDHGLSRAQLAGVGDAELIVRAGRFDDVAIIASPSRPTDPEFVENLQRLTETVEGFDDNALARWEFRNVDSPMRSRSTRIDRLVAADWSRQPADETFHSVDGRLPMVRGEVALDRRAADQLNLGLGERFETTADSVAAVVGIVTPFDADRWTTPAVYVDDSIMTPELLAQRPALGLAMGISGLDRADLSALLADYDLKSTGTKNPLVVQKGDAEVWKTTPSGYLDPGNRPEQAGSLVTAALLVETGLLAAAAFAVGARRRVTEVARLTALGATPRQVSRMMLTEAGLLGLCGALVGVIVAVGAALASLDSLVSVGAIFNSNEAGAASRARLHLADVGLPAVLAVVVGMVAAWLPARRASHISSREAENRARNQNPLPARWTLIGPGLLVASLAGIYWADHLDRASRNQESSFSGLVVFASILLLVGAAVAFSTTLIAQLSRWGHWLPLSLRFGFRHMARNRNRSAMLAGGAAVVTMTAVVVQTLFSAGNPGGFVVPAETTMARVTADAAPGSSIDIGHLNSSANLLTDDASAGLSAIEARVDFDKAVPLHYVTTGASFEFGLPTGQHQSLMGVSTDAVLATPELISALALDRDVTTALRQPGTAVVTTTTNASTGSLWRVESETGLLSRHVSLKIASVDMPEVWGAGVGALVSPDRLPDGFETEASNFVDLRPTAGWLIISADGFTKAEQEWLLDQPTVDVASVPDPNHQDIQFQLTALAIVTGLVLIVARLAAGLVAVESDGDVAIMTAVGAPIAIRRRLLGSQVGAMTALSVLTAIPLGLAFAWTTIAIDEVGLPQAFEPSVFPAPLYFIGLALLLPVAAAGFVMVTTRSASTALSRRLT